MAKPTVILADDHMLLTDGMTEILRDACEIVAVCSNGRALMREAERLRPDVITFDIGMPEMNGIEAARRIHRTQPEIRLVCVTQQIDMQYLNAALQAGATGFVAKQAASSELLKAIEQVLQGHSFITPMLRAEHGATVSSGPCTLERDTEKTLTPRQREVLQGVAEGRQSKEIATALNISTKTVEFHRAALMNALGLRSTAELTRYAIAHGIVQP